MQLRLKHFAHSRIFKDRNQNSRTFQGLEFFLPIPGLSRIFKDHGNPEYHKMQWRVFNVKLQTRNENQKRTKNSLCWTTLAQDGVC